MSIIRIIRYLTLNIRMFYNQSYNYHTQFREVGIYVKLINSEEVQFIRIDVHKDKVPQFITDYIKNP